MSLDDLKKQVTGAGDRTLADTRGKIIREGEAHQKLVEHQEQRKFAKSMETISKNMKGFKSRFGRS